MIGARKPYRNGSGRENQSSTINNNNQTHSLSTTILSIKANPRGCRILCEAATSLCCDPRLPAVGSAHRVPNHLSRLRTRSTKVGATATSAQYETECPALRRSLSVQLWLTTYKNIHDQTISSATNEL